jgi:hypothetical protein
MKFLKISSLALLSAFALNLLQPAHAFDVIGPGGRYVKVTNQNNHVKFEECFKGSNPECFRTIGPKVWYSVEELQSQRATETYQAYGSIVAVPGVIFLSMAGGVLGGAAILTAGASMAGAAGGVITSMFIGAPLGVMGGVTLVTTVDALNPAEQFKQSGTLSDDVINDRTVTKPNISKYIDRLEWTAPLKLDA